MTGGTLEKVMTESQELECSRNGREWPLMNGDRQVGGLQSDGVKAFLGSDEGE